MTCVKKRDVFLVCIALVLLFLPLAYAESKPELGSLANILKLTEEDKKHIETPGQIVSNTVCGDKICEGDEVENCYEDCSMKPDKTGKNFEQIESSPSEKEAQNMFARIIWFFKNLFGKKQVSSNNIEKQVNCQEYCVKQPHVLCVGQWKSSGAYPDCTCNFYCETEKTLEKESIKEEPRKTNFILAEGIQLNGTHNWPMLGNDPEHQSFSESEVPEEAKIIFTYTAVLPQKLEEKAEKDVQGLVYENGILYFCFDHFAYAFDVFQQKKLWYFDLGGPAGGLAVFEDKILVSGGKNLFVLNKKTSAELWKYSAGEQITAPVAANDFIYFGSNDYNLHALKMDGTPAWKFPVKSEIHSVPAVSEEKICFGTENPDFSIYCLNALTGKQIWRHQFSAGGGEEGGMFHAPPAIAENKVLIGEEGGKRGRRISGVPIAPAPSNFYALNLDTGEVVWKYNASDWIITSPAVAYGKVYFSTWNENLYALNLTTGEFLWKANGRTPPAAADGKVFVGASNKIISYQEKNGSIVWEYPAEDKPAFLIFGDGLLYAGFSAEDVVHEQIMGFGK